MKLDELDLKIIRLFRKNGRTPNNEIAEALGIAEGTVRNRLKALMDGKLFRIKGLLNPNRIREKRIVFIGIKTAVSKDMVNVARSLAKLRPIRSVVVVTGRYDIIAEIFIEPFRLIQFISRDLSKIDSIVSTETFMALRSFKKWV